MNVEGQDLYRVHFESFSFSNQACRNILVVATRFDRRIRICFRNMSRAYKLFLIPRSRLVDLKV